MIIIVGKFLVGLFALVAGADVLVRGASALALRIGLSPLVVGLTVVALGTSAPELAVSVQAAAAGQADITLGNVVGSNIANVLLILGIGAVINPLKVSQQLVRIEIPIMIALSGLVLVLALDGDLSFLDGMLLVFIFAAYTTFAIRQSRKTTAKVRKEYQEEVEPPRGWRAHWAVSAAFVGAGLALLVFGATWMVEAAVEGARGIGMSELLIALTVVAVGTSLPEIATSVVAAFRNQDDIAVGNAIGSNIANLSAVLGASALAAGATGLTVAVEALHFDIPIMLGVAVATLPIVFYNFQLARWEGGVFLGYFAAYIVYSVMRAGGSPLLSMFTTAMAAFIFPLTLLTFGVVIWRARRRGT